MVTPAESQPTSRRPGRPRREEGEHVEVRERLLDAATRLAVEQGFGACGLREIAARAEVSSGMISYYFGDRQGLHQAMFQRAFDRVIAEVEALLDGRDLDAGDRLDEILRIFVSAIAAEPWLVQMLVREVLASPDSDVHEQFAAQVGHGPMQLLIRWLAEEQARGVLQEDLDPTMVAISIVSVCAHPYMMIPIIGAHIGIEIDDTFAERLLEHNQKILAHGIRAPSDESRSEETG
jgi:AcrR family transcriptional regulator